MLTSQAQVYLTAWLVGLLGGVHCLTMCGGLVGSLTLGLDAEIRRNPWRMLSYQVSYSLGRIGGYVFAGALFGGVGALLLKLGSLQLMQHLLYALAGVMMILLGLYLAGWWRLLGGLERLGAHVWRRVEPFARRLLPVRTLRQTLVIGFLWAWIPCGLVYSVLITAVATGSVVQGAGVMLAFGLGTLPNLVGIAMLAGAVARIAERDWVRQLAGLIVLGFGAHALWQLVLGG